MTPGAVKLVPLTQTVTLAITEHGGTLAHLQLSGSDVEGQNFTLASNCDRLVIGRDEQLVRSIVSATGIERTKPGPIVRVD